MKNVIVFTLGGVRYALELRWVREILTLGYVTPVPAAPRGIGGAVNVRGTVTPVIDLGVALGGIGAAAKPRRGEVAIIIEVERLTAAVRVANVDTVTTMRAGPRPGILVDGIGGELSLIDAPGLLDRMYGAVAASREHPGREEPT